MSEFSFVKAFHKPRVRAYKAFTGQIAVFRAAYTAKGDFMAAQQLVFQLQLPVQAVYTITTVAQHRHAQISKMGAYLMGAAGDKTYFQQGKITVALYNRNMCLYGF